MDDRGRRDADQRLNLLDESQTNGVTVNNAIKELQKLAGELSLAGHDEAARMTHRRISELEEQERQSIERWRNQRD